MECAGWNFENRDGAKFGNNCGAKLDLVYPSCGHSCESDSSFWHECGHDLKGSRETLPKDRSFDEKLAKIQRYLPSGLTDKILAQRDRIGAHRCNLMMFHLGRDYAFHAELFKWKGDRIKAQERLVKATEILKDRGTDGWVTKAEERLASLS